jgi:hypothetical protein
MAATSHKVDELSGRAIPVGRRTVDASIDGIGGELLQHLIQIGAVLFRGRAVQRRIGCILPQVSATDDIDAPLLARAYQLVGARQQHDATRAQVVILTVEARLIERREVIHHLQPVLRAQLDVAIAQIHPTAIGIKGAVATGHIEIARTICRQPVTSLPETPSTSGEHVVIDCDLLVAFGIIAHDPAFPARIVAVGTPIHIHYSI